MYQTKKKTPQTDKIRTRKTQNRNLVAFILSTAGRKHRGVRVLLEGRRITNSKKNRTSKYPCHNTTRQSQTKASPPSGYSRLQTWDKSDRVGGWGGVLHTHITTKTKTPQNTSEWVTFPYIRSNAPWGAARGPRGPVASRLGAWARGHPRPSVAETGNCGPGHRARGPGARAPGADVSIGSGSGPRAQVPGSGPCA